MDIDAVEQWAGDLGDIALDHGGCTHALAGFVVEVATGARVVSLLNLLCSICRSGTAYNSIYPEPIEARAFAQTNETRRAL
jgi:hypothetical protein